MSIWFTQTQHQAGDNMSLFREQLTRLHEDDPDFVEGLLGHAAEPAKRATLQEQLEELKTNDPDFLRSLLDGLAPPEPEPKKGKDKKAKKGGD